MRPTRTALGTTTNPLVVVVVTWALLWGHGTGLVPAPSLQRPSQDAAAALADPVWESSWSRRFPGCVALALWPQDERPVALVTRSPDGVITREPPRRPNAGPVVGACR